MRNHRRTGMSVGGPLLTDRSHRACWGRTACLIATVASTGLAGASHPRIESIGVAPGDMGSHAVGVSADGTRIAAQSFGVQGTRPYRWTHPGIWEAIPTGICDRTLVTGISADGEVVIGHDFWVDCGRAFRWSTTSGREDLATTGISSANAVSADGYFIVGSWSPVGITADRAYRWTPGAGLLPLSETQRLVGHDISADGSTIVGAHLDLDQPWRWTDATGIELIDNLPAFGSCGATAISGQGNVIAGSCGQPGSNATATFRWTQASGTVQWPIPPGWSNPRIHALSGDGLRAVGEYQTVATGPRRAAIWTSAGAVDLHEYLVSRGVNMNGWELDRASDITPDGDIIVGRGTFNGQQRGWIAYLSGCYANCDGSTTEPMLNVDDFTCFINAFAEATTLPHEQQITHYANCDHSTAMPVLTVDDFTCFINSFAQGCP